MTLSSRGRRRSAAALIVAGAGSLTLDQRLGRVKLAPSKDALAGDWKAVGGDLRRALTQAGEDFRAA